MLTHDGLTTDKLPFTIDDMGDSGDLTNGYLISIAVLKIHSRIK